MAEARPPLAYLSEITPQYKLPTIAAMGNQLNPYGLGTATPTAENITAELVLNRPDSTMRADEPNWKDRWGAAIAGSPDQPFAGQRRAAGEALVGSSGLGGGEDRMSLADLAGVSGAVKLGQGIIGDREMLLPGAADVGSNFMPLGKLAIFAGVGAKTANRALLDVAKDLAEHGLSRNDIWDSTGWFQGADKKWRFEIPDDISHFKGVSSISELMDKRGNTVKDVFYHQPAYEAYPGLGDIELTASRRGGPVRGSYQPGGGLSDAMITIPHINTPRTHGTLLHEIQHGVQEAENFGKGGNTFTLKPGTPAWDIYQERLKAIREPTPKGKLEEMGVLGPEYSYDDYLREHRQTLREDNLGLDRAAQEYAVTEAYRRMAGEVEARNVQARMFMTPAQRRAKPPWETQDIPDERQIVRFR